MKFRGMDVIKCDFRLPPWCKLDLRSSEILHSVHW